MKRSGKTGLFMLLALLMAGSVCIGCGDTADTPAETESGTQTPVNETTVPETDDGRLHPKLPENLDFEGHTFTILNNDYSIPVWSQIDIGADAMNGDRINDAVYTRNHNIAEQYNCKIASEKTNDLASMLTQAVQANDQTYDIATPYLRTFASLALNHMFLNIHDVDTLDLSMPWYDQNSIDQLSVAGVLYGVATDLTLMDEQATGAMIFNKALYADYNFDEIFGNIYTLVEDGKWTYDVFSQMVTSVSGDLDGDGKQTDADIYGLLFQRDTMSSLINGFGINYAVKNEEDLPEFSLMTDQGVKVLESIFDLIYQNQYCMNVMKFFGENGWSDGMVKTFADHHAMFMWIRLADCANLRTLDLDFGIIPVPKYDEAQEQYRSAINSYVGVVTALPTSCYDPEKEGYFLEAISSESRYLLLPEYYEINLKGKVSRDEESARMLDLIFTNRLFDLGEILDPGSFANTLIYMTMSEKRDYASRWAKVESKAQTKLAEIIDEFRSAE